MTHNHSIPENDIPIIVPVTSITDEENQIRITMEMPGISEEAIRIELENIFLSVSASDGEIRFCKEITLPCVTTLGRKKIGGDTLELVLHK